MDLQTTKVINFLRKVKWRSQNFQRGSIPHPIHLKSHKSSSQHLNTHNYARHLHWIHSCQTTFYSERKQRLQEINGELTRRSCSQRLAQQDSDESRAALNPSSLTMHYTLMKRLPWNWQPGWSLPSAASPISIIGWDLNSSFFKDCTILASTMRLVPSHGDTGKSICYRNRQHAIYPMIVFNMTIQCLLTDNLSNIQDKP